MNLEIHSIYSLYTIDVSNFHQMFGDEQLPVKKFSTRRAEIFDLRAEFNAKSNFTSDL